MQLEYIMKQQQQQLVVEPTKFTQSQSHGLFWDSEIRVKVFHLPECINDTRKYDIECGENGYNPSENVSIKATCSDTIDCGDILRFFSNQFEDEKYTNMLILKYQQKSDMKQIQEIIEFKYDSEIQRFLFGTISIFELEQYCNLVKSIPGGSVSQDCKKEYKTQKKELQIKHNMYINISPKVDSKTQRRVQCSIPKISHLFTKFPHKIISRTLSAVVKGVEITSQIYSLPRIRKIKPFVEQITDCNTIDSNTIITHTEL